MSQFYVEHRVKTRRTVEVFYTPNSSELYAISRKKRLIYAGIAERMKLLEVLNVFYSYSSIFNDIIHSAFVTLYFSQDVNTSELAP